MVLFQSNPTKRNFGDSRIMYLWIPTILAFGLAASAAQLTQVADYGGDARAKPKMFAYCLRLLAPMTERRLTKPQVRLRARQSPNKRPCSRHPLLPIVCTSLLPEQQDPLASRVRQKGICNCLAELDHRMLGRF